MKENSKISMGIIYFIIAAGLILLSFGNPLAMFITVPLAVGFAVAGYYKTSFSYTIVFVVLALGTFLIFQNVMGSILILVYSLVLSLVLIQTAKYKIKFTLTIGWATLLSFITVLAAFLICLYIENGNISLEPFIVPIKEFGSELAYESGIVLAQIYETAQIGSDVAADIIDNYKNSLLYLFDGFIAHLPGIFAVVIMVGAYVAHIIAKGLTSKMEPKPIECSGIFDMRLPAILGISYFLAYFAALFVEGQVYELISNYVFIIELPLMIEGVIVVYSLLTVKVKNKTYRTLIAVGLGLSLFGIILNITWIYVVFGAMDTYLDFRKKLKINNSL